MHTRFVNAVSLNFNFFCTKGASFLLKILGINKLFYGLIVSYCATPLELYQNSSWLGKFAIILAPPASVVAIIGILENFRALRTHCLQKYCEEGYKLLGNTYAKEKFEPIIQGGMQGVQRTIEPIVRINKEMKTTWEEWAQIVIHKIPFRYKHQFKNPPNRRHWVPEQYALKMHYWRLDILEKIIEENNNTLSIAVNINFSDDIENKTKSI